MCDPGVGAGPRPGQGPRPGAGLWFWLKAVPPTVCYGTPLSALGKGRLLEWRWRREEDVEQFPLVLLWTWVQQSLCQEPAGYFEVMRPWLA